MTLEPAVIWHLDACSLGHRVEVYEAIESTNTLAMARGGNQSSHGLVILADVQQAGRGQMGRTWTCLPRQGVLMSIILFPPPELRRPVLLTAWAAVSVCEAIWEIAGLRATIKWPNDILLRGQKVCGILIEQGQATVVGIGLNVSQSEADFSTAGLHEATSLMISAKKTFERDDVARHLLLQLDRAYAALQSGDMATLESRWVEQLGHLGREVVLEGHEGQMQGHLRALDFDAVVIETASGEITRVVPEAVRQIRDVS